MYISPELRSQPPDFDYDAFSLPENIALTFRFSPHNSDADLPSEHVLHSEIKQADAAIVEMVSQDDLAPVLAKVSRGDVKAYRTLRDKAENNRFASWLQVTLAAVYNSNTPVTTIDCSADDRVIYRLQQSQDAFERATRHTRTEDELLSKTGLQQDVYEAYRARDQVLLANVGPRLEALTARSKFLHHKRLREPAVVSVYYGDMHTSLFDALRYKNGTTPTNGFSVQSHAESVVGSVPEAGYAFFLRTGEVSPKLMILDAMRLNVMTALITTNPKLNNEPIQILSDLALDVIKDNSFEEVLELCQVIRRMRISRPTNT